VQDGSPIYSTTSAQCHAAPCCPQTTSYMMHGLCLSLLRDVLATWQPLTVVKWWGTHSTCTTQGPESVHVHFGAECTVPELCGLQVVCEAQLNPTLKWVHVATSLFLYNAFHKHITYDTHSTWTTWGPEHVHLFDASRWTCGLKTPWGAGAVRSPLGGGTGGSTRTQGYFCTAPAWCVNPECHTAPGPQLALQMSTQ
jgi:hypothetical protein